MNTDQFERLLSRWLDDPQRADLRMEIDAAAAADPALRKFRDEWQALSALLCKATQPPETVCWTSFQDRINTAIDSAAAVDQAREAQLDATLRDSSDLSMRVDWPRLVARIGQALDSQRPPILARPRWLQSLVRVGGLAAAAALAFLFTGPRTSPPTATPPSAGVARALMMPTGSVAGSTTAGIASAGVTLLGTEQPASPTTGPEGEVEVFLVVHTHAEERAPAADPYGMF